MHPSIFDRWFPRLITVRNDSLPTAKISNPDVTRMINSTEIQSVVRAANPKTQKRPWTQHKNPLRNKGVLFRLNPYAKTVRRQELRAYPPLSPYHYPSVCSRSDCIDCVGCVGIVRQERVKAKKDTKPAKKATSASKEFLETLLAP